MDEHRIAGVCAYITDFMNGYAKDKSTTYITKFVEDRFSKCTKDKKIVLYKIFTELSTKMLDDGNWYSDNYNIVNNLLKVM